MKEKSLVSGERQVSLKDWIAFLTMTFGMFMAILDVQIVSSSLNEIQAGVSASADEIVWVQTSYLIAEVIMIPFSGFLSRVFSTRILFTLSCLGFTVSSFGCAFSETLNMLIFFRLMQGFLGGAMIPTVFATSFILFPPEKRAFAAILTGLVATTAPTLGPTIGGYLTETLSWHWLFLVNIFPGFLVAFLVWTFVDFDQPDYSLLKGFDFYGLTFMALFLGSLEYILEEGPRHQWLEERSICIFLILTIMGFFCFVGRVLTYHNPIVDLRAYKDANFAFGSFFSFILGIGLYGLVYLLPLYLSLVRGFNALQIGTTMFVTGMFQFTTGPIVAYLMRFIDLRILLTFGMLMFALNSYLCSFLTADFGFEEFLIPQILRGIALMFCFIPINMLALGTLPKETLKNASGLYNTARNLGGAIGLALINSIIIQRLAHHRTYLRENIGLGKYPVDETLTMLDSRFSHFIPRNSETAALKKTFGLVTQQAYILTFADIFYLIALVFFGSAFLITFVKKPLPNTAPIEAHE